MQTSQLKKGGGGLLKKSYTNNINIGIMDQN